MDEQDRETKTDKLLRLPGIQEALDLVTEQALFRGYAEFDAMCAKGELDKAEGDIEDVVVADKADEWMEDVAPMIGGEIARLWELSASAGDDLAFLISWHFKHPGRIAAFIYAGEIEEDSFVINKRAMFVEPDLVKGRLYLDVTDMSRHDLLSAYSSLLQARQALGILKCDLREGAPEAIDTQKALEAAYLAVSGVPLKKIATELGFPVYTRDNPSGSYPLLRKYVKRGREIIKKLGALDRFLCNLP